ncbi:peptidoglycan-binding protein [Streptomyces sp. NPDC048257]|uniref:peptidoglycan-binding domain-containing protein n=1 Tax=Streptomyces sp. NPDC048257 TaxID=3365526 RepID=UPI0037212DEC
MRIRPYVALPDPGEPDAPAFESPVLGAVTLPPGDTPAYGMHVPPEHVLWPEAPAPVLHAAHTVELQSVSREPAPGTVGWTADAAGAGRGSEERTDRTSRRLAPLLFAAAAVTAVGGTAMLWTAPGSSSVDFVMLPDAVPSAPAVTTVKPGASPTPSAKGSRPSPSASRSPSASASASASPSRSTSPDPSRSALPSASPSASHSPVLKPPPPAQVPTLRYGDSGSEVEKLQRLLAAKGGLYKGKINGRFDWYVKQAVSKFQVDRGIDEDGRGNYGPATRRALEG